MDTIKDRNSMDLKKTEEIKKTKQEYSAGAIGSIPGWGTPHTPWAWTNFLKKLVSGLYFSYLKK